MLQKLWPLKFVIIGLTLTSVAVNLKDQLYINMNVFIYIIWKKNIVMRKNVFNKHLIENQSSIKFQIKQVQQSNFQTFNGSLNIL